MNINKTALSTVLLRYHFGTILAYYKTIFKIWLRFHATSNKLMQETAGSPLNCIYRPLFLFFWRLKVSKHIYIFIYFCVHDLAFSPRFSRFVAGTACDVSDDSVYVPRPAGTLPVQMAARGRRRSPPKPFWWFRRSSGVLPESRHRNELDLENRRA